MATFTRAEYTTKATVYTLRTHSILIYTFLKTLNSSNGCGELESSTVHFGRLESFTAIHTFLNSRNSPNGCGGLESSTVRFGRLEASATIWWFHTFCKWINQHRICYISRYIIYEEALTIDLYDLHCKYMKKNIFAWHDVRLRGFMRPGNGRMLLMSWKVPMGYLGLFDKKSILMHSNYMCNLKGCLP